VPGLLLEISEDTRHRLRQLYSKVSDNMSNWDYWRGTFEAAQAQAQVAASQASKFAEVVSAQVRTHTHLSTHCPCSQQETSPMKLTRPLKSSHMYQVMAMLLRHAETLQCYQRHCTTIIID
jgi:hypothetical protein